jgi:cold shock CspA family protein
VREFVDHVAEGRGVRRMVARLRRVRCRICAEQRVDRWFRARTSLTLAFWVARPVQPRSLMVTDERASTEIVGRIAYIDPSKQWGYLYGPVGERVYFHATTVLGEVSRLELGAVVCYRVTDGSYQLCAAQVTRCPGAGR